MEYPKFVPAGNSAFNPNEMIDLADIFDGKRGSIEVVYASSRF
jgi:hypothetical protein